MKKKLKTNPRTALSTTYFANFYENTSIFAYYSANIQKEQQNTELRFKTSRNDETHALAFLFNFNTGTGIWSQERLGNGIETPHLYTQFVSEVRLCG